MSKDAYKELLDIPEQFRPPTYYQLLGVKDFESDTDVIERASRERIRKLRARQLDPRYEDEVQQLLSEVVRARRTLLEPESRTAYNHELRGLTGAQPATPGVKSLSSTEEIPRTTQQPREEPQASRPTEHPPDIASERDYRVRPLESFQQKAEALVRSVGVLNLQVRRHLQVKIFAKWKKLFGRPSRSGTPSRSDGRRRPSAPLWLRPQTALGRFAQKPSNKEYLWQI